jgi:hypothetical protein
MAPAASVVGIDLGTTNSALAWARADGQGPALQVFAVPQLVAAGSIGRRQTLPSFLYLPGPHDLPPGAIALPWAADRAWMVGELARSQGALIPGRLVASAKSWLCHPAVDRTADILPWGADRDVAKLSPVEASSRYLRHLVEAWDVEVAPGLGGAQLADQDVVLTVPASFDEVARELTLKAAEAAGLRSVTLLEEPQAAFYSWLQTHGAQAAGGLAGGELVLVCDIGGGTTDFTLIAVRSAEGDSGGPPVLERVAVGDHLLLGGDNMDLALARVVEARLGERGSKLDPVQWQALIQSARQAKEELLSGSGRDSVPIVVKGSGRSVIGGALRDEISRADAVGALLEGFFPRVEADASPEKRARAGLLEWGLPYASDPAVTRHLAAFLRRHGQGGRPARPTAVLFNGGVLKAQRLGDRLLDVLADWAGGERPRVLDNDAPDLAVAKGAAYYGLVRHGHGIRIQGGAARGFYLEVGLGADADGVARAPQGDQVALCVAPWGMAEGAEVEVAPAGLSLVVGRPVRFRVLSSSSRKGDQAGHVVRLGDGEAETLPSVFTVLRPTRPVPGGTVPVRLRARTTEIGTLELWCEAPAISERWRLQFDLRAEAERPGEATAAEPSTVSADRIAAAQALVRDLYRPPSGDGGPFGLTPATLLKKLESVLDLPRNDVPPAVLRALWDPLRDVRGDRGRSPDHEARWLHLAGFFLRPGFGYPLDDWRMRDLWRIFGAPVVNEKASPVHVQWWILWRRVAGGLRRTQQEEIGKRIIPLLLPSTAKGYRKPPPPEVLAEMWRTAASLEHLPAATKARLGDGLVARVEKGKPGLYAYWTLGRLGARVPLYARVENVVPRGTVEQWLDRLLAAPSGGPADEVAFALVQLTRRAGDRMRDVDDGVRARVMARLKELAAEPHLLRLVEEALTLEADEQRMAYGDALPPGLLLVPPPEEVDPVVSA